MVRHLTGDGVVYSLAHISAVLVINLLKGHIVLVVDSNGGVGGGQVAQRAAVAGDEVIAQIQTSSSGLAVSNGQRDTAGLAGNDSFQSRSKGGGAEFIGRNSNVVSGGAVDLSQCQAIGFCGISLHRGEPRISGINGVGIVVTTVSNIKNLVSGVGLTCNGVVNGDAASPSRKGSGGQAQDHDQCQQKGCKFSCVFH